MILDYFGSTLKHVLDIRHLAESGHWLLYMNLPFHDLIRTNRSLGMSKITKNSALTVPNLESQLKVDVTIGKYG